MTPTPEEVDAGLNVFESTIRVELSDLHLASKGMILAAEVRRLRARIADLESEVAQLTIMGQEHNEKRKRLVAAGDTFRNMIELAPQAPPETWPTDDEMNEAVAAWDAAKGGSR